jgi:hypothetical protein
MTEDFPRGFEARPVLEPVIRMVLFERLTGMRWGILVSWARMKSIVGWDV